MQPDLQGAGPHYIKIGNGQHIRIADYVAGIQRAKANPERSFTHGLGGWWPERGSEILREFQRHLDRIINRKAGVAERDTDARELAARKLRKRIQAGRIMRECRWCGNPYQPWHARQRTCDEPRERPHRYASRTDSCTQAYWS